MVKLVESSYTVAAAAIALTAVTLIVVERTKKKKKTTTDCPDHKDCPLDKKCQTGQPWASHVGPHGPWRTVWPQTLWVLEASGCSMGPPVRNMTVYRVPDGSRRLVIYNGVAVDETAVTAMETWGTPTVLVVPNAMHRCCAAVWKLKYPDILVVCPESSRDKVTEIVPVDYSTQTWAIRKDWSEWIHIQEIDGWCEMETIVEVELDEKAHGKRAMLVADLLFTLVYNENAGYLERLITWFFDSSTAKPAADGSGLVIPKISRIGRIFGVKDWTKVEAWYRSYAREHGTSIAVIAVGHGAPVVENSAAEGCTEALNGVADQLLKPRW